MHFVKTFKGYEDRPAELDKVVNEWLVGNADRIRSVIDIKAVLSHETGGRAGSGDLLFVVVYDAAKPLE